MARITEIRVESHVGELLEQLGDRIETALEMIGLRAERHAKEYCPVDTGRLRNSITHTYSGKQGFSYSYTDQYKAGSGGKAELGESGRTTYNSSVGSVEGGEAAVYIGTNVEYAAFVELGTSRRKGKAKPYLRPALENHMDEYRRILQDVLESG